MTRFGGLDPSILELRVKVGVSCRHIPNRLLEHSDVNLISSKSKPALTWIIWRRPCEVPSPGSVCGTPLPFLHGSRHTPRIV